MTVYLALPVDAEGRVIDRTIRSFATAQERDDYARKVVAETGRSVLRQWHNYRDAISEAAFTSEWTGEPEPTGSKCLGVIYGPKDKVVPCENDAESHGFCPRHLSIAAYNEALKGKHALGDHSACNPLVSDCCAGEDPNDPARQNAYEALHEVTRNA